jgi:hypothetical protein
MPQTMLAPATLALPTQQQSSIALQRIRMEWGRHLAAWAGDTLNVRAAALHEMRWSRRQDFDVFYDEAA